MKTDLKQGRNWTLHTGIVHQDIKATIRGQDVVNSCGDRRLFSDVNLVAPYGGWGPSVGSLLIKDDDPGAGSREPFDDGLPQPTVATGDNGDAVREVDREGHRNLTMLRG